MPDCYKYISKDIGADCNALIQPGVEQKAVIINRADIDMTKQICAAAAPFNTTPPGNVTVESPGT